MQGTRPSTPPHVVAQRAPGCNRSSRGRAVLEGHRAFGFLGEAAASFEATSFGHPADSKNAVKGSKLLLQRPQPNPQNLVENLNSEEPSSPTPSIPDPELWSVPLRKWGLHGSTMESSQHAPTGDSHKNTAAQAPKLALQLRKMAELLGACLKFSFTRAPPPLPGRQQGLRPVALSSGAFCVQCPKHFMAGRPPPETESTFEALP